MVYLNLSISRRTTCSTPWDFGGDINKVPLPAQRGWLGQVTEGTFSLETLFLPWGSYDSGKANLGPPWASIWQLNKIELCFLSGIMEKLASRTTSVHLAHMRKNYPENKAKQKQIGQNMGKETKPWIKLCLRPIYPLTFQIP